PVVSDLLFALLLGASLAWAPQNASPRKNRRWNLYRCHDRDGCGLCVDHLFNFCSRPPDVPKRTKQVRRKSAAGFCAEFFRFPLAEPCGFASLWSYCARNESFATLKSNLPATIVWYGYYDVFARRIPTAIGAGDSDCIDASIAVTCPLGSEQHMMIIQHNPVWGRMAVTFPVYWLVARH